MDDANHVHHARRINQPEGASGTAYSYLLNATPDRAHRFEVIRLLAVLQPVDLQTGIMSHVSGKLSQSFEGISKEAYWLRIPTISKWIYRRNAGCWPARRDSRFQLGSPVTSEILKLPYNVATPVCGQCFGKCSKNAKAA
jgi:hypothetical protein